MCGWLELCVSLCTLVRTRGSEHDVQVSVTVVAFCDYGCEGAVRTGMWVSAVWGAENSSHHILGVPHLQGATVLLPLVPLQHICVSGRGWLLLYLLFTAS